MFFLWRLDISDNYINSTNLIVAIAKAKLLKLLRNTRNTKMTLSVYLMESIYIRSNPIQI